MNPGPKPKTKGTNASRSFHFKLTSPTPGPSKPVPTNAGILAWREAVNVNSSPQWVGPRPAISGDKWRGGAWRAPPALHRPVHAPLRRARMSTRRSHSTLLRGSLAPALQARKP